MHAMGAPIQTWYMGYPLTCVPIVISGHMFVSYFFLARFYKALPREKTSKMMKKTPLLFWKMTPSTDRPAKLFTGEAPTGH